MVKIDSVGWLKIKVKGVKYHQALISGGKVFERDDKKLRELFNTTHRLGDWEEELLLAGKPEIIIIGSGWQGVLKMDPQFQEQCAKANVKLQVLLTPKAVRQYNKLIDKGKKVNALIHTTC
jgi:hypothetical protein